jgi:hypothetical protein
MTRLLLSALSCALALSIVVQPATGQDFARLAPYQDIVFPANTLEPPRVLLDGEWFELLSIDGSPVAEIIGTAQAEFGSIWQKRVAEDLVEVLAAVGAPPGVEILLGLRSEDTGEAVTRTEPMTAENRAALWAARQARAGTLPLGVVAARLPVPADLAPAQIAQDLETLEAEMEARWAYLRTTGVDHESAIEDVRARGADAMAHADFGVEVLRVVSMFVDGHATVRGFDYPDGMLPFFIESTGDRFVAIRPDRSAFLDPEHPYVTHLDGRPLDEWLEATEPFESKASPQWMRRNGLELTRRVQFMRDAMGIERSGSVVVDLASEGGDRTSHITVAVPLSAVGPSPWPATESGIIGDDVGYLRLPRMDAAAVTEVFRWMPRFRETRGLIVDVRGNGGGSRDALRALFPYLMSEGDAPRVVNAARYRLHPDYTDDHLGGSRYMYRESWPGWPAAERDAIARFRETFEPEWLPPDEEFSDWHYLVMSRAMNPDAYTYGRPVVVLLDPGSFSATDIFVSALKGWHDVTLVGTPSGGGSARQIPVRLPVSGLVLNLASMASFQWTGLLHDGNGTQPDVLVRPDPEYFLEGGRDNVLEAGLELLP